MRIRKKTIDNKGITLIALVITIVILLILAGITINTLTGDNGLFGRAKQAKENMLAAQAEEQKILDELESYTYDVLGLPAGWESSIATIKNGVPIPKEFYYVGGTKSTGVVISDNVADENKGDGHDVSLVGNQFVWVPCTEAQYERTRWSGFGTSNNAGSDLTDIEDYEESIVVSIKKYGGFYIARYEASGGSGNTTATPKSVKGATVWVSIDWNNAKASAEKMYEASPSVKSVLVTGRMWDRVCNWFLESPNAVDTITDGTGKGNYSGTNASVGDIWTTVAPTGGSEYFKQKNIYDMYSNVYEWTAENYSGTTSRVIRGGNYHHAAASNPVVYRSSSDPTATSSFAFRVSLYLL